MKIVNALLASALAVATNNAFAASGEMGMGVPHFGVYSEATGNAFMQVWSLANATRPLPSGCTNLILKASTMGIDTYKLAFATLTAAKLTGRAVRFYAHAERDGGCGVDYVELQ